MSAAAAVQGLLCSAGGLSIIYLAVVARRARQALEDANQKLSSASQDSRVSEARARDVIELAPDAFFLTDGQGRFLDVNQAACRMLGSRREEVIGRSVAEVIAADDVKRLPALKAELLAPGRVGTVEWTHHRKDGTSLVVEVSSKVLPDGCWQAFARDISDRKRIQDELRESEIKFHTLAESVPEIVWITRPDGWNTYINQRWLTYTGLTLEQTAGHGWRTPFHPDEKAAAWEAWQRAVRDDVPYSAECRVRRADGVYRWWLIRGASLHDQTGAVINWFGTCTDVDDIKRTEEALRRARDDAESINADLRESEERFRLTIDEAPIGMALVSASGRFVRVNRALCEIVGHEPHELTDKTFQAITHPDDLDADLGLVAKLRRGDIPRYQLEKRYLRKDGTIVDVLLSASIIRDPNGAPRHYIAQIEDITERKRAETALRVSEAKFSGIVSIAADAIISVDPDQRIVVFNEGAEHIFGYSKAEALGAGLDSLIPERFRATHRRHFAQFAAAGQVARKMGERQEIFGLRKNGEEFPAEGSISKVSAGGATFFSVVLRDITERRRTEEDLRRALTARDNVLAIVAHDLRNPLSTITMQCAALERRDGQPERRRGRAKEMISRAAARMNRLIQDLLDVTLVEAGELKVECGRIGAGDLALEAAEAQRPIAAPAGLELRLEVADDVPEVWGGHHRLLQVFENLIGNALKFTPAGGHITVGAASADQEVVFWVADTGSGIAPESLPHVFDRFWQATTRAGRLGAGLGLPITKGIVEAHGGRIWVESTVGRGTTFFFTIPKALADEARPSDAMH